MTISVDRLFCLILLTIAFVNSSAVVAQDIDLIRPRAEVVDPLNAEPTITSTEEEDETVGGSPESVGTLRGVRLVSRPGQVAVDNPPTTIGVVIADNDLVVPSGVKEAILEFVGGPLSMLAINEMSRAAVLAYREAGMPVVDVAFPEQNVSTGVLQMVVVIGRAGAISVQGNKWFKEKIYLRSFTTETGDILYEAPILNDLHYLNRNPYRSVNLAYTPGTDFGEADVILQANERRPWTVYGGYEDTGNEVIGEDRLLFGFDWGNAFGIDHRLGYQYTTTTDIDRLHAHAATYTIPFWQTRHELRLLFGYVESDVALYPIAGIPLTSGGESSQVSGEYVIPLPDLAGYEHEIGLGFDFKSTNNNLEFGGLSVIDSTVEVYQFAITQRLKKDQSFGQQAIQQRLVWSPGDLSNHNSDASFQALRALATAEYFYWDAEFTQSVNLPGGFLFLATAEAQLSDSNLLPTEALIFGGVGSVRGFEQNLVRVDQGTALNLELYGPAFRPFDCIGLASDSQHQARVFGFYDYAVGGNVDPLPGEPDDFQLGGTGLGIDIRATEHASLRLSHAWQVIEEGFSDGESSEWHVSALVKW